jgi:hypothetical protein
MSKLKYLNDALWAQLPLNDFRARFFIECYTEKLRMQTPHFYQCRLLNIFSACAEMLEHIEALQENEKNGGYVVSSMEEIVDCWDADPIAQDIFGEYATLKSDIAKKVKATDLNSGTQNQLKALCRAIIFRKNEYLTELVNRLEDSIIGGADLDQTERITSLIDRLVGLYVTHLLNQGYSPTYLYNRVEMLIRPKNYAGRDFAAQFRQVTDRLRNNQSSFDVYYGFHTTKPSVFLSINDEPDLEFLVEMPAEIAGSNLEKFKKGIDVNVVAKARLTSTDYVTAALRTKERLDRFLDAATALEFGSVFQESAYCITINRDAVNHTKSLNVEVLLAFMSSENGTAISHSITPIRQIFRSLDETAKEQLGRSLRHLRFAKNSVSLEQKLLNLWIALESLFSNEGSTIIGNILEFVPKFYAINGISRRVAYLRELLVVNEVAVTPTIAIDICPGLARFDSSVTENQIFKILRNEAAAKELFNGLNGKEHLKFKLIRMFEELKNNKALSLRLERSESDVNRQLRRIYFLRNKIAHTGHFRGVRPQLVTHLLDYVATSYRVIAAAAGKAEPGNTYSISELLAAARMGADLVASRVASKDEVFDLDRVTLHAVI